MRHKPAYGLNLAIRTMCMQAAAQGIDPAKANHFLNGLAGRIPDGQLRDYERRIVRASALDLPGDSPLDESELAALYGDLAVASCFDALFAGGANVVPLRARLGIVSQAATGDTAANASTKTVSRLEFDGADVEPSVALALVVMSQEFFNIGLMSGGEVLEREIVKSAAVAVDTVLVAALTAGTPATAPSTGNFAQDLRAAFAGMPDNAGGRYYCLAAPSTVRQLSAADDGSGQLLFPDIDAGRGGPAGSAARVLPCSALATAASAAPDLVIVDAATLALGASRMNVSLARHASLDMSDTPAGGAQSVVSLWQTNSVAFRAERSVSAKLLRDAGVFVVSGADYSEAVP